MRKILFVIIPLAAFSFLFYYYIENDVYFRADIRNFLIDVGLKKDFERPYSTSNNKPIAYYAVYETISIVAPINNSTAQSLPQKLVIPSGVYMIYGNVYNLEKEGIYRFVFPGIENSQRIVYDGENIEHLLSAVSWIYTHGNSDSDKNYDELNKKAMNSKIYGICNTISIWILKTLEAHNTSARLVQTMTLDEWNTYDNSHTMIEVYRNDLNKWVLYDLDNNAYFTDDGIPLSLYEFVDKVQNDDYEIKFLASDTKLDISNFKSSDKSYDFGFIAESITSNESSLRNWYKRIAQVPLIQDTDFEFYFPDDQNRIKIEKFAPNYKFIEKEKFLNQFYG